jgi:hypothetical protein
MGLLKDWAKLVPPIGYVYLVDADLPADLPADLLADLLACDPID